MTRTPLDVQACDGAARAGTMTSARGPVATPCFMPVGTRGAVKTLSSADLEDLGVDMVLANAYHLMLRPGATTVAALGGLHRFTGFQGNLLSDSGGFQVFSLQPDVDDDGVTFRSTYDGSTHRLTPEGAVAVQEAIGADIQMVLDVCLPLPCSRDALRVAVDRTAAWATRARAAHRHPTQALFGIVQGGTDEALRRESARRTVELHFDGHAIGGLSVGESRPELLDGLAAALADLPADRPRYLMGVGDPVSMVEAIALGVDLFDCVLPTRAARHGTVLTTAGRLNLRNARHATDQGPLDPDCSCPTCARWSRGYLRHLLGVGEPTAARLLTLHNLHWTLDLVRRCRTAIVAGTFAGLRRDVLAAWG